LYDTCVQGDEPLNPVTITTIRRAEPLITPFLESTDANFICEWNGVRTAAFMASTAEPESLSKDKGKASGSSSLRLKVLPPALSPDSTHSTSEEDDDDMEKLLEPVKRRVKITAHDPIAPPSSQTPAGSGKKGAKPSVDHEPFQANKHKYWLISVSLFVLSLAFLSLTAALSIVRSMREVGGHLLWSSSRQER